MGRRKNVGEQDFNSFFSTAYHFLSVCLILSRELTFIRGSIFRIRAIHDSRLRERVTSVRYYTRKQKRVLAYSTGSIGTVRGTRTAVL